MEKEEKFWLVALVLLSLAIRLPFLGLQAFVLDEALYAQMIDETAASPSLIPNYLGQEVAWRPPLFFFAYAPFVQAFLGLGLPIEVAYRLPSAVLGSVCVLLLYVFARKLWGRDVAFAASVLFSASGLVVYVNSTVLTDTLLLFFILLSLNFYVLGERDRRLFLAAGLVAACAFLVKTVVAFIIPALAVAYFAAGKREVLLDKYFVASFLLFGLAIGAYFLAFSDRQAIVDEYLRNVAEKLPGPDSGDAAGRLMNSIVPFIALSFYMVGFYVVGAWHLRRDWFVLAWIALGVFALFGGQWMPWYFLPIAPVLSVCAGYLFAKGGRDDQFLEGGQRGRGRDDQFLEGGQRGGGLDPLGKAVIAVCSLAMLGSTYYILSTLDFGTGGERAAGIYLAGKENVLVAGSYSPTLVFYKGHLEGDAKREFCWRIPGKGANLSRGGYAVEAVFNYSGAGNSRITDIFWNHVEFALPCNITGFDYVSLKRANASGLLERGYAVDREFANNVTVLKRTGS